MRKIRLTEAQLSRAIIESAKMLMREESNDVSRMMLQTFSDDTEGCLYGYPETRTGEMCEWVAECLRKKMRRGIQPDAQHLTNSSVVANIMRVAVKKQCELSGVSYFMIDNATKREIRGLIADFIMDRSMDE